MYKRQVTNLKSLLKKYSFKEAFEEKNKVTINLEGLKNSELKSLKIELMKKEEEKKRTLIFLKSLTLIYLDKNKTSFEFKEATEEKIDLSKLKLAKEIKITDALK